VVDTVLVDQETIYAPRHGNDRLLLGSRVASTSTNWICCASVTLGPLREGARGELVVERPSAS